MTCRKSFITSLLKLSKLFSVACFGVILANPAHYGTITQVKDADNHNIIAHARKADILDEGDPCGPDVVVGNNITVRGFCRLVSGGDCDCQVEHRCPNAAIECVNEDQDFYCCCYVVVQPPEVCFDDENQLNAASTSNAPLTTTSGAARQRSKQRRHHAHN